MLTKEERAAIAERFASYDVDTLRYTDIYACLFGKYPTGSFSVDQLDKAMIDCLINLCDTSNMIELPRDKDGEVIHVGDVVYETNGAKWQVHAINLFENGSNVSARSGNVCTTYRSDVLVHKKPAENAVLAEQIRAVIRSAISMPKFAINKLSNIADQLEKLGDSDD
nr:MAG TPA: hypothetical protein [Caudoviricetes sp.]